MSKVLSIAGTAFNFLFGLVQKHPKGTVVLAFLAAAGGFLVWRLKQPFDQMQTILLALGPIVFLVSIGCLYLEKRDPQPRLKAEIVSASMATIGLMLFYLGIRPV